ncbi:MAG: CPBP family intramembrane metalloprotease [Anaerolineales bacterium]
MASKQWIAIVLPPILVAVMIPAFRLWMRLFPAQWRYGWFLGLATYWLSWCAVSAELLVGRERLMQLIHPQRLTPQIFLLLLIPLAGAALYHLVPGMRYDRPTIWITLILIATTLGNGFFEEILWRGIYLDLFPDNFYCGVLWPSLWFALWHYAPGSGAPGGKPWGLMIGAGVMGFYLSFLARRTGTIWWTIVVHTLGGLIIIL